MLVYTTGRYKNLYNTSTIFDFYSFFIYGYIWFILLLYVVVSGLGASNIDLNNIKI
jgi:hypothetical protein